MEVVPQQLCHGTAAQSSREHIVEANCVHIFQSHFSNFPDTAPPHTGPTSMCPLWSA